MSTTVPVIIALLAVVTETWRIHVEDGTVIAEATLKSKPLSIKKLNDRLLVCNNQRRHVV